MYAEAFRLTVEVRLDGRSGSAGESEMEAEGTVESAPPVFDDDGALLVLVMELPLAMAGAELAPGSARGQQAASQSILVQCDQNQRPSVPVVMAAAPALSQGFGGDTVAIFLCTFVLTMTGVDACGMLSS